MLVAIYKTIIHTKSLYSNASHLHHGKYPSDGTYLSQPLLLVLLPYPCIYPIFGSLLCPFGGLLNIPGLEEYLHRVVRRVGAVHQGLALEWGHLAQRNVIVHDDMGHDYF